MSQPNQRFKWKSVIVNMWRSLDPCSLHLLIISIDSTVWMVSKNTKEKELIKVHWTVWWMPHLYLSEGRHVYAPDLEHDGSKCSLHSAEKDVGPDPFVLVSLTFFTNNRLCLGSARNRCKLTPSLVVLLHPAAIVIHLVGIAKKMQERTFSETYKLTTWITCTCKCVYSTHWRQIRRGSMFNRGRVCLDWRHRRG